MNSVHNAQLLQVALAEQTGLAAFTIDRGKSQNSLANEPNTSLLVPMISVDEAVQSHGLPPPDLLKMDVEGAESAVLKGARRTVKRYRPILFIALHGEPQRRACETLLRASGYRVQP